MVTITVFVEGSPRLREGFDYLFRDYLKGRKVFNMSKGKTDALKKFKQENKVAVKSVLIDLDRAESDRSKDLKEFKMEGEPHVYYMVQEMEAWFLSQPEILDRYFNRKISAALNGKYAGQHPSSISSPKNRLKAFVKETEILDTNVAGRENYDEVADAMLLLKKLDLNRLKTDFKDVDAIISLLN